ncbi:type III pantothenate kinase [Butyricicoccus sp.]|uniref:type III pantothenate kinase n=1 Tax=Butyricicoccus sp. TaxID=2049021 RepID=UPI003F13C254
MLLAINAQNSAIALGCFDEDGHLRAVARIAAEDTHTADQYACQIDSVLHLRGYSSAEIYGAVLCSVVPSLNAVLHDAVKILCGCEVVSVSSGVKTGLSIQTENPRALGSDLVCVAVEAAAQNRLPALVVDMNTATTFTALDSRGVLVGSAIAPGVRTGLETLREKAAQLPSISLTLPENRLLGKNTVDAMASGVLNGAASMVDGMIGRCREQLGDGLTVYLTGTDAPLIAGRMREQVRHMDDMVLYGLYRIWLKNRKK